MDILHRHELFEMEILDRLHRSGALVPLVFGGGSMLRLCHELNRFSVDLDFWIIAPIQEHEYFSKTRQLLEKNYDVTDAQIKHYTILFDVRSTRYPRRLKLEIRRETGDCDYEEKIAFSRFGTQQVLVKAHTLEQTMKNKISAFLDRAEVRDCFDIEFLLRRGVELPSLNPASMQKFQRQLDGFTEADFKVKLGSILESDVGAYYISRRFAYLREKLRGLPVNLETS